MDVSDPQRRPRPLLLILDEELLASGSSEVSGIPYATPHALRHGAAAIMINLGANPVAIQQRLGHKHISITLGTYGHLFPLHDAQLAEALDQARSEAVQSMCSYKRDIVSI